MKPMAIAGTPDGLGQVSSKQQAVVGLLLLGAVAWIVFKG